MLLSTSTNLLVCQRCNCICTKYKSIKDKLCNSCYKKEYYIKNSQKIQQQNKEWKIKNPEKVKEIQRNNRVKRRLINKCPSCKRICHKTKHFLEVHMCRECFDANEKKKKYQEKIDKKKENEKNRKLIRREKSREYYQRWYYKNKDELLERKRAGNFLVRKKDQDAFDFYLQNEKASFQKIWELEDGKKIEEIQKKIYRDSKQNKEFKKTNVYTKKIKYGTSSIIGKGLKSKNGKSFEWSILKDMIYFQNQIKSYGLEKTSLFNHEIENIITKKIEKEKERKRQYQKKYYDAHPEKRKEISKKWANRYKEKIGEEEYRRIQNEKQKIYYKKIMDENPEKLRAAARKSYKKNRDKILEKQKQKYRAKKNIQNLSI